MREVRQILFSIAVSVFSLSLAFYLSLPNWPGNAHLFLRNQVASSGIIYSVPSFDKCFLGELLSRENISSAGRAFFWLIAFQLALLLEGSYNFTAVIKYDTFGALQGCFIVLCGKNNNNTSE